MVSSYDVEYLYYGSPAKILRYRLLFHMSIIHNKPKMATGKIIIFCIEYLFQRFFALSTHT